jgi:DNA invertase Pin-like site-specific DNA recombinase
MSLRECILYARVSSREQREGYSVEAQIRLLRDYAAKLGLRIAKVFIDEQSATNPGRKYFGEMVEYFKRNRSCLTMIVEKVDRLYRNKRDPITIEDLNIEVHFVKDNEIISKDSRSGAQFIHDIRIAMARNYSANLSEEVIKGMLEKCRQGYYPFNPPHGYAVDKATGLLVLHPEKSKFVRMAFELYATGLYSLKTLKKELHLKTNVDLSKSALERILKDRFYIGSFEWRDETFSGKHPLFIDADLFAKVQAVFTSLNKPKGCHQDIAFRGLFQCHICGRMITGERKKGRYVYYRCTERCNGHCKLPRFREQEIGERLSAAIAAIRLPKDVAQTIETTLRAEQDHTQSQIDKERTRLTRELSTLQTQRDDAYTDKLKGEITVEFWRARQAKWAEEELAIKAKLASLEDLKTAQRLNNLHITLELAQTVDSKLVTANEFEKADLVLALTRKRSFLITCRPGLDGLA